MREAWLSLCSAAADGRGLHTRCNRYVAQCVNALLEMTLLTMKMIQSVSMKLGDNDTLAAYVATMLRADLTVILTKVDGMFHAKPVI